MALNSVRVDAGRSSNVTLVIRPTISDIARDSSPALLKNTTGMSDQLGWQDNASEIR